MKFPNTEKFLELCEIEKELNNLYSTIQSDMAYIYNKQSNAYCNQVGRLLGIRAGISIVAEKIERNDKLLNQNEKNKWVALSRIIIILKIVPLWLKIINLSRGIGLLWGAGKTKWLKEKHIFNLTHGLKDAVSRKINRKNNKCVEAKNF